MLTTVDVTSAPQALLFLSPQFGPVLFSTQPYTPQIGFALWVGLAIVLLPLVLLILGVAFHLTEKHRDITAIVASILFLGLAFFVIHYVRILLGINDSATLVALLILPLLLYGVLSGRLSEFSAPGGWGAKFKEVAQSPVDISSEIDLNVDKLPPVQEVPKTDGSELRKKIADGVIHADRPLAISLELGKTYEPEVMREYIRTLSFADLRFFVVEDKMQRVCAYVQPQIFADLRDNDRLQTFVKAIKEDDVKNLISLPGVRTKTVFSNTTNAEVLSTMDQLALDAIPVLSSTFTLLAIADRNRIVSQILNALMKHGNILPRSH